MISVIIPVGPNADQLWLKECLNSVWRQTLPYIEIVVVGDGADVSGVISRPHRTQYIQNPWRLGQAASLNIGIAQAKYDLVFTMGGYDDTLRKACLYECLDKWWRQADEWGIYHPTIVTSEDVISTLPQGVYLFERKVWAAVGGYPPAAGTGEVDSCIQGMWAMQKRKFYPVAEGNPLYWHREHPNSLTALKLKSTAQAQACNAVKVLCTKETPEKTPKWATTVYGY